MYKHLPNTVTDSAKSRYRQTVVTPVSAPRDEWHDVTSVQYMVTNKKSKHLCPVMLKRRMELGLDFISKER